MVFANFRVVARDAAGNTNERIVSYRVQIDQRPVVDIVEPLPGQKVVEGSKLWVNGNAFDDVAIDHVRLYVTYLDGTPIYEQMLRTAPYNWLVDMPSLAEAAQYSNILRLRIEALDSYGAKYGDIDNHRAVEELTFELVEDAAPTVAIGTPLTGDRFIEGQAMLVQVNAIDDIKVDSVVLRVNGVITGDITLTDFDFPYDFIVDIPAGQAGHDIHLTAVCHRDPLSRRRKNNHNARRDNH